MKKFNIKRTHLSIVLSSILLFTNCDDFLNIVPRDKVSSDIVFTSYHSATSVLGGVYDHMTYSAEGFMVVAQSLGIHNFILAGDMMGQDIIPKNYSSQWHGDDYNFSTRTMEKDRPAFFWFYCYGHINVLNDLLSNISKMQGAKAERVEVEAEARTLRAFHYLLLAQWFQQTYLINPKAPGVPLYFEPSITSKERSSLEDVYNAIIEDLKWVLEHAPKERRNKSKYTAGLDVARGLLVRSYMEVGQYKEAKTIAHGLVGEYPLMDENEYIKGFNDVSISECIWGLPCSSKNTNANYSLPTVWSHPRKNNRWSQRFIFLNNDFVSLFEENDIRKTLIKENPKATDFVKYPERKYVSYKIMDPDDSKKLPDVLLMRSSEMLLIEAECAARLQNDTEAQELLFLLQKKRNPATVKSIATGTNLLDEILLERRKELYGEGFALLDIKRFRKPLVRSGLHTVKGRGKDNILYEADSNMFTLQIPEGEIQTNKIEQNP